MTGNERLRITYLIPTLNLGGTEKHILNLAANLRMRGHDARIATVFKEGFLAAQVEKCGVPFVCLTSKGWGWRTFIKIFNWIRSNRVDILHTYLFGFHFFAALPAKLLKIPFVVSSRRELAHWQKKRHLFIENMGNLCIDRVVCCSHAAQQWTLAKERIQPNKILTIHNGVDLNRFSPGPHRLKIREEFGVPAAAQVLGTVANFSYEKAYPYLLETMNLILTENPQTWFLLVGSGPLLDKMKCESKKIARSEQIVFTGFREDIPDLMDAMDVFALASLSEGFPNVLLEAMAMAKPVVATDVGGIPELISSGNDGVLVHPKDGKAMAAAILQLLRDPQTASRLGETARNKIASNFTIQKMVDQYENFYLSLSGSRSAASVIR